jgi:hypothetical protein
MLNSRHRPQPNWYHRATRQEIDEIEAIDQLMANLRDRRKRLINRTNMRTQVWVERHRRPAKHFRRATRIVSLSHLRKDEEEEEFQNLNSCTFRPDRGQTAVFRQLTEVSLLPIG